MLSEANYEVIYFGNTVLKSDDDYPDFLIPLADAIALARWNVAFLFAAAELEPVSDYPQPFPARLRQGGYTARDWSRVMLTTA